MEWDAEGESWRERERERKKRRKKGTQIESISTLVCNAQDSMKNTK